MSISIRVIPYIKSHYSLAGPRITPVRDSRSSQSNNGSIGLSINSCRSEQTNQNLGAQLTGSYGETCDLKREHRFSPITQEITRTMGSQEKPVILSEIIGFQSRTHGSLNTCANRARETRFPRGKPGFSMRT